MERLQDSFGRSIEVLRISVTDRCNFRCVYCMPPQGVPWLPPSSILHFEEIRDVVVTAVKLGITRVRLTGGEPLVRKGIVELVRLIAAIPGLEDLAMTTNGSLLAPMAKELAHAGLKRVNISLDTMDEEKFRRITRLGSLDTVLAGIDAAVEAGLVPVKLNIVLLTDGSNDNDARAVEAYAARKGLICRRIRQMDFRSGVFGTVQNSDRGDCRRCNRIRLTSDGYVRACLFCDTMFSIRELGIEEAIRRAVSNKSAHGQYMTSYMSQIGG